MSSKPALILKHVPNEDAGTIKDFLEKNRIPFVTIDLYEGKALPADFENLRAIVVMGGPMNVDEEEKHPFLKAEKAFIREAIGRGIPCLGICLGSQLMAKALGKKVYKAQTKEVGWQDVKLTEEARTDRLFSCMTYPSMKVLQWHEDTFDLPDGAVLLASSPEVPHQAYRYRENIYGLQFHIEINRPMLEDWFAKSPDLPSILAEYDAYCSALNNMTTRIYTRFFLTPI